MRRRRRNGYRWSGLQPPGDRHVIERRKSWKEWSEENGATRWLKVLTSRHVHKAPRGEKGISDLTFRYYRYHGLHWSEMNGTRKYQAVRQTRCPTRLPDQLTDSNLGSDWLRLTQTQKTPEEGVVKKTDPSSRQGRRPMTPTP
jgi:hypothetical protein